LELERLVEAKKEREERKDLRKQQKREHKLAMAQLSVQQLALQLQLQSSTGANSIGPGAPSLGAYPAGSFADYPRYMLPHP
jgi:hypothetical protein